MKKKSGLKKEKKKKLSNFKFRTALVIGSTFLAFGWIILILFYIQIVKGEEYRKDGEKQYKSRYTITAKRGRIISNDGEILPNIILIQISEKVRLFPRKKVIQNI